MRHLLAADWLKMRHRWMPRILILVLVVLLVLVLWGLASDSSRPNIFPVRGLLAALLLSSLIGAVLWPIMAGAWAGNEYSWGTVRLTLGRRPNRVEYVLSAIVTLMAWVTVSLLLAMLVGLLAGGIAATATGHQFVVTSGVPADILLTLVKTFLSVLFVGLFFVSLAYAAGTIFQSPAAGIGLGIGLAIAEQILDGIFMHLGGAWQVVANHLPAAYIQALPSRVMSPAMTGSFVTKSGPGVGECLLGLGLYIAGLVAITLLVFQSRDVTG